MTKEDTLVELHHTLQMQRRFEDGEPEGWQSLLDTAADNVKAAFPNYLSNKRVLLPLIEARAITPDEAEKMPASMKQDFDVARAFVKYDPWRHDIMERIEHFRNNQMFMDYAVAVSPRVASEVNQETGSLDDMIREAQSRTALEPRSGTRHLTENMEM